MKSTLDVSPSVKSGMPDTITKHTESTLDVSPSVKSGMLRYWLNELILTSYTIYELTFV